MDDVWRVEDRWYFALSVPWLTHKKPVGGENLQRFFSDQLVFLRSLAKNAPVWASTVLQLRYWTSGASRALRCNLFGAADTKPGAVDLLDHVLAALPRGLPLEAVSQDKLTERFKGARYCCEVRRAVQRLDLDRLRADPVPNDGVLIPWQWTPSALESSLYALARRDVPTALAVNIQPAVLNDGDRSFLTRMRRRLEELVVREAQNQLASIVANGYAEYLRDMHDVCIDMRVMLVSEGPLGRSLPNVLGCDLSSGGIGVAGLSSYEVAMPRSESEGALLLGAVVELGAGSLPRLGDTDLVAFAHKFPTLEANLAFRFPVFANDLVIADW